MIRRFLLFQVNGKIEVDRQCMAQMMEAEVVFDIDVTRVDPSYDGIPGRMVMADMDELPPNMWAIRLALESSTWITTVVAGNDY